MPSQFFDYVHRQRVCPILYAAFSKDVNGQLFACHINPRLLYPPVKIRIE
jgi:hypothetical protein